MRPSAVLVVLVAWLTLGGDAPASFKSPKAKDAQKSFDKAVERLKADYETKLNKARKDYLKALEAVLKDAKKSPKSEDAELVSSTIETLKKEIDRSEKKAKGATPEKGPDGVTFLGGSGESIADAVVIKGAEDSPGAVIAEDFWLKAHYPKCKKSKQGLIEKEGKSFDKIEIETASGETKEIYFDITECIGFPK